jgi:hypothetical protein
MTDDRQDAKLISTPFFFDFAVPCRHCAKPWTPKGVALDEAYGLPGFGVLDQPADEAVEEWADVRMAWNEAGLLFNVRVSGKRQPPWCRASRIEDSDGLAVWINTRHTPGIHRANRFCHAFRFLPSGGGPRLAQPVAAQMLVDRAREDPRRVDDDVLKVCSEKRVDGYLMAAFVPAEALTGFDPNEHPRLSFTYAVMDRELGQQTLTVGSQFPYDSDPSLWSVLELERP